MGSPLTISTMTEFPNPSFDGTEQLPLIWSAPGNGLTNYNITSQVLAILLEGLLTTPTILEDEATYASVALDTRILVKNSMAFTTTITLLPASSYLAPILVKDIGGFASEVNPITVLFTGGEEVDGLAQIDITNPYGSFWFNPLPSSIGGFYGP